MNIIKQINQKGIRLHSKWQEANERITQYIKLSKKQQQLPIFFQCIFLIEMNQPGKEIMMRNQAKKMNDNLYRDLLDYSDKELIKTPQDAFILIAKSYALSEENKFQEAIEQCEKVLREEPFYRHALYNRCDLIGLSQYSSAISSLGVALKHNSQYSIGCSLNGIYKVIILGFALKHNNVDQQKDRQSLQIR